MLKKIIIVLCIFAAVLFLSNSVSFAQDDAPDFSLFDTQSQSVTLSSFKGYKPVLLFFWTTWCPYCVKQLKVLNDTYGRMSAEGIKIIPINVGESVDKVSKFLQRNKISFASSLDANGRVSDMYGLIGVPTYALVDVAGKLAFFGNDFPAQEYKALLQANAQPVNVKRQDVPDKFDIR